MSNQTPTVRVIPVRENGVFKQWNMSMNASGNGQGPGNYKHIEVNVGNTATITFKIVDPQGITFAPNNPPTSSPIYIQSGTSKPVSGVDPQFQPVVLATNGPDAGIKLTVPDSNTTAGAYTYQLNFVGAPPLDPIVDNGGPGKSMDWAVIVLGIALLAAVVYFFAIPMFTRNRSNR